MKKKKIIDQTHLDLVANKILNKGMKLFKREFKDFYADEVMLVHCLEDFKDFVSIVKLLHKGNLKHACIKAWCLDTMQRDALPESMYKLMERQENNAL